MDSQYRKGHELLTIFKDQVHCDMKNKCFVCKRPTVINGFSEDAEFFHCEGCRTDVFCELAIGKKFNKTRQKFTHFCPKCGTNIRLYKYSEGDIIEIKK